MTRRASRTTSAVPQGSQSLGNRPLGGIDIPQPDRAKLRPRSRQSLGIACREGMRQLRHQRHFGTPQRDRPVLDIELRKHLTQRIVIEHRQIGECRFGNSATSRPRHCRRRAVRRRHATRGGIGTIAHPARRPTVAQR